jgi:hypothetical protein
VVSYSASVIDNYQIAALKGIWDRLSQPHLDAKSIAGKSPGAERHAEIVVGAGPAGIAAAIVASTAGAQVLLIDENPASRRIGASGAAGWLAPQSAP